MQSIRGSDQNGIASLVTPEVIIGSTGMVKLPPIHGGAIESYVCDLAKMATSRGFRVTVVSGIRESGTVDCSSVVPVPSPYDRFPLAAPASSIAHLVGGGATASSVVRYLRGLPRDAPAVLHMNEEISAALVAKYRPDIPKLFTLHNPPPEFGNPVSGRLEAFLRNIGNLIATRFVTRKYDGVIALNTLLKDYLAQNWKVPAERIHCLPLPVDTDTYSPPERPDSRNGVLFVGRLDERKKVRSLLRAYRVMNTPIPLTIVGDGPLRGAVLSYISAKGLSDRCSVRSRITTEALIREYRKCALFAFPSGLEMYPRSVVEAAACGLPVVMPDLPMYRDFVEGGFVRTYSSENESEFGTSMEELHSDITTRKALGKRARENMLANNGYLSFSKRLRSIYTAQFE